MNERLTNEEREALLAEHTNHALSADETQELAFMTGLLADPSTWAAPTDQLEDAVVQAVEAAPSPTAATPGRTRVRHEPSRRRRRLALSAIAAAAAVAISLGTLVTFQGTTSPDYTAQLSATGIAPRAQASADITRNNAGFRIMLHADGLPKLPAGEYYQAWLKNATGTLVPIGTFSSSDACVTLWSGVSPSVFPTLTVPIEKTDNDQNSSGRRVLVGQVHAG